MKLTLLTLSLVTMIMMMGCDRENPTKAEDTNLSDANSTLVPVTKASPEHIGSQSVSSELYCTTIPVREASKKCISMIKTGQSESNATYDDGYYHMGADRSYTRDDANETVTDTVTGLMWQDDSDAKNNIKDWSDAYSYCADLNLSGYSDWRLPDIYELGTTVNFGKVDRGNEEAFKNFFDNYHWSSTSYAGECSNAWLQSYERRYTHNLGKTSVISLRCVRGGETLSGGFARDSVHETVVHNTTGLIWQDNADAKTLTKTWKEAITYCEALELGGHKDWRLPNRNEMMSVIELANFDPAIDPAFNNVVSDDYWTSTTRAKKTTSTGSAKHAFAGRFYNGEVHTISKKRTEYVRCVR